MVAMSILWCRYGVAILRITVQYFFIQLINFISKNRFLGTHECAARIDTIATMNGVVFSQHSYL